jgi:pimeloyl-ACP methyl ester carboxylesterase
VIPETRYAKSGDVNIAYQVLGEGPIDLVFVPGWVSHVEFMWEDPRQARFLNRLASFSRLLLFDKRGVGLSDRVPVNQLPILEERIGDVRAVMDAAGSERAALFGVSEGGAMSALFAATARSPERGRASFRARSSRSRSERSKTGGRIRSTRRSRRRACRATRRTGSGFGPSSATPRAPERPSRCTG